MIHKSINDFNNNLTKYFNFLSINGKYNIVGSSVLKGIYYNNDIDLNEKYKINSSEKLAIIFQNKYKEAYLNENIFITDFKCGKINDVEMHWNKTDIANGFIKKDDQKLLLKNALLQKTMCKLDMIIKFNGCFIEITEVYFFNINNHLNYDVNSNTKKNLISDLVDSKNECYKEKQYFKVLKRLFSIFQILTNHPKEIKILVDFFNSSTGLLYKCFSDVDILITLINNNFRKPNIEDIKNNLQIIKQNLSNVVDIHKKNVSIIIDDICKNCKDLFELQAYLKKLNKYLFKIANNESEHFLESNFKKYI